MYNEREKDADPNVILGVTTGAEGRGSNIMIMLYARREDVTYIVPQKLASELFG